MNGRIKRLDGWMNYQLEINGQEKPRRIYWRNHNNPYIKINGAWERIYFNHWIADENGEVQMARYDANDGDGECWQMI